MSTDKNGDGKLSKDEASERLKGAFDEIDTNKDGQIDADELKARMTSAMRRGPRPGGDRPDRRGPRGRRPGGPPEGSPPPEKPRPESDSVDGNASPVTSDQTAAAMWQFLVAPWL